MKNKKIYYQKILNSLLDEKFLKELFDSRLKIKNIKKISIYPVKKTVGADFYHLVVFYILYVNKKQIKIFCSASANRKRKISYQIIKYLYDKKFSKGPITLPKPLFYDEKLRAMFYRPVDGENLLTLIINKTPLEKEKFQLIAKFLYFIHNCHLPKKIKLPRHKLTLDFLDPTPLLPTTPKNYLKYKKKILELFGILQEKSKILLRGEKKYFIHGDIHPENIIAKLREGNSKKIAIIDFTEGSLSHYSQDLGSFLQQLRFKAIRYYSKGTVKKWEREFLKTYFKNKKIDPKIRKQIYLFEAWTALKSSVFFIKLKKENRIKYLLKEAEQLLKKI